MPSLTLPRGRRLWGLLVLLSASMLIDALEVSTAVVSLPAIGDDIGMELPALQGVVSGFALGFGGALLLAERVVERFGRRRVFLVALTGFAVASLVGALAGSGEVLIVSRVVKGVCVALTAPTGLAIITTEFREGRERNRAVSVYTTCGAAGFSAGLLLAGVLTEVSWRWTFASPVPVALGLAAAGLWLIPRDTFAVRSSNARNDVVAGGSLAGSLGLLVFAMARAAEQGWSSPLVLGALLGSALLLGGFLLVRRAAVPPLIGGQLLRNRTLMRSAVGAALFNGSYWAFLVVVTVHLQSYAGWSPLQSALAILPASAPVAFLARVSAGVAQRVSARWMIASGAVVAGAGYALYSPLGETPEYTTDVLPTMVLVGVAFVLAFSALHVQAMATVPDAARGPATALYQSAVQIGGAVTVALAVLLVGDGMDPTRASIADRQPVAVLIVATATIGVLAAVRRERTVLTATSTKGEQ